MLSCLEDESNDVRQAALRLLRDCQQSTAKGTRLVAAMIWQERDRTMRCNAIEVLARISPSPKAVAATFAEVLKDRDAEVRAAVLNALNYIQLSPKVEVELLPVALQDGPST